MMPIIDPRIFEKQFAATPSSITDAIRALCTEINPQAKPIFVRVKPDPSAEISECFPNVEAKIQKEGGSICNGWAIWEWPRVYIEAEHHAVWSRDGELLDITPHTHHETSILFLPDPDKAYDSVGHKRLLNRRRSLGIYKSAGRWIEANDQLNNSVEENSIGQVANMSSSELDQHYASIAYTMSELLIELACNTRVNDQCICSSGKKFKKCCKPLIDLNH